MQEKRQIIVPINKEGHWTIVIIVNPANGAGAHMEDKVQSKATKRSTRSRQAGGGREGVQFFKMNSMAGEQGFSEDARLLKQYLVERYSLEALGSTHASNTPLVTFGALSMVRTPEQPNFCDCGVYMLHYIELWCLPAFQDKHNKLHADGRTLDLGDWFPHDHIEQKRIFLQRMITGMDAHHPNLPEGFLGQTQAEVTRYAASLAGNWNVEEEGQRQQQHKGKKIDHEEVVDLKKQPESPPPKAQTSGFRFCNAMTTAIDGTLHEDGRLANHMYELISGDTSISEYLWSELREAEGWRTKRGKKQKEEQLNDFAKQYRHPLLLKLAYPVSKDENELPHFVFFVLCHVVRRPIVVDSEDGGIWEKFRGIYLPLGETKMIKGKTWDHLREAWGAGSKEPIVLRYDGDRCQSLPLEARHTHLLQTLDIKFTTKSRKHLLASQVDAKVVCAKGKVMAEEAK
jgi:hypothetical protein